VAEIIWDDDDADADADDDRYSLSEYIITLTSLILSPPN